jgi:hypothetical protein
MQKAFTLALFILWVHGFASANRQFECYVSPIQSKIGFQDFTQALNQNLFSIIESDASIKLLQESNSNDILKMQTLLRKDLRFPEKEAVFVTFIHPDQKTSFLTLLYKPENRRKNQQDLIQQLGKALVRQLKAESIPNLQSNLASDMNHNIFHIDVQASQLKVELIGKQTEQKYKWEEKVETLKQKRLPVAEKKQPKENKVILGMKNQSKPPVINPEKVEPEPTKRPPIPLDPFAAKNKAAHPDYLLKYPRLQNGGLAALIITPQLNEIEMKGNERFAFSTSTSVTFENFENTVGTTTYKFDGRFQQQHFSIAARLWSNMLISLDSAYGVRDSDVQFDALHPSAAGGTTFLTSNSLDYGLTDTTISLSYKAPIQSFSLRPVIKIKAPTGSETDLLGSGHLDYSAGVMANVPFKVWTWGLALHLIIPGNIGNFDPAQGDLPAANSISFQTGFARSFQYYGPLDFAISYHFMQNPLRELSSMPETEEDIHNIGILLERQLKNDWTFQTQASAGLSPSAANASISIGFDYQH